jgi:hypothetical protein
MAVSPFRFYRGAAAVMAWDLARTPSTGVNVQACGDAHVLNFGGYASPERRLVFDVNDFDETLPAPWEYDLKRLVVSVVLDGRVHGFSEDQAADAVRVSVDRYRRVTRALAEMTTLDIHFAHIESRRFLAEVDDPAMAKATRKYVRKARRRTNVQAFRKWVAQVDGRYRFVDEPPPTVPSVTTCGSSTPSSEARCLQSRASERPATAESLSIWVRRHAACSWPRSAKAIPVREYPPLRWMANSPPTELRP